MRALDHDPDILVIEDATEGMPFTAACRAAMRGKLVLAGLEIRGTRNVLRQLLLYQQQNYFLPIFVNGLVSFKGIQLLCPECRTDYYSPERRTGGDEPVRTARIVFTARPGVTPVATAVSVRENF